MRAGGHQAHAYRGRPADRLLRDARHVVHVQVRSSCGHVMWPCHVVMSCGHVQEAGEGQGEEEEPHLQEQGLQGGVQEVSEVQIHWISVVCGVSVCCVQQAEDQDHVRALRGQHQLETVEDEPGHLHHQPQPQVLEGRNICTAITRLPRPGPGTSPTATRARRWAWRGGGGT